MMTTPKSVWAATLFVGLNALIWAAFGVAALGGVFSPAQIPPALRWVMALMALAAAGLLGLTALLLARRSRLAWFAALAMLAGVAVLSLADEIGLLDLVSLALSAIPIVLLIKERRWFLPRK